MLRHQANGRRMSSQCPYGQQPDPESELNRRQNPGGMKTNGDEAGVVEAVQELAAAGLGPTAIAAELGIRGFTPRGRRWHHQTVTRILRRL